ncbi:MAG: sigma-54-dependent Fis family transcriptional regulator [Planctomycetes bacterium]|nr:sigma-54-dependent Fis family transcriptional regulator [Planctomycetota bacterium]
MTLRVLVVDDEETVREELIEALADSGYEATGAIDGQEALESALEQSFDVCITDINMPRMNGLELVRRLGETSPETLSMIVTAQGDLKTAVEALRVGAADYVLKPLIFEDILAKVARLSEHRRLVMENRNLRQSIHENTRTRANQMIGDSASMVELHRMIAKVAPTRSNVLILGESGTGKELIARAIHESSDRSKAPLVPINCAAIPETLLESELFGHVKGAFTGADSNKEGLLKTAGEGTIFLDELGDMPLTVQAKLLRAIENREIQPVGSVRRIPIHARIIAATNMDLPEKIAAEEFREDLYYRMAVVEIRVPPLRERREDIPALVRHFVEKYRLEVGRPCAGVSGDAMRLLMGYSWKGNIRELENTIERAMILFEGECIEPCDLPEVVRGAKPMDESDSLDLAEATSRFESQHIHKVLDACEGDKRQAARIMGISLSSLYRKLDHATSRR